MPQFKANLISLPAVPSFGKRSISNGSARPKAPKSPFDGLTPAHKATSGISERFTAEMTGSTRPSVFDISVEEADELSRASSLLSPLDDSIDISCEQAKVGPNQPERVSQTVYKRMGQIFTVAFKKHLE